MKIPPPSKRFQPRRFVPGQPWPEDKRTEAQKQAGNRNFGIFKLRGLWSLCGIMREPWRTHARNSIDADLIQRGAEAESVRDERRRKEWLADVPETEIPF